MTSLFDSDARFQRVLSADDQPDDAFNNLLLLLGELLDCDRCFLYLRNPQSKMGKITHCWVRNDQYPNMLGGDWQLEPEELAKEDPLFAAALLGKSSVYVEDVNNTSPDIVNRVFEEKNFGHRALIHAHLRQDGTLWGILQPCIFGRPRVWTASEGELMGRTIQKMIPLAIAYVKAACQE